MASEYQTYTANQLDAIVQSITVWFCFYETLEREKLIHSDGKQVSDTHGWEMMGTAEKVDDLLRQNFLETGFLYCLENKLW